MQIAQIAPLTEAIPPKLYGGTERVISWLADELVGLGHDVVLFASGDSQTSAKLEACRPKALRLDGSVRDPNALHIAMLERVRQQLRFVALSSRLLSILPVFPSADPVRHYASWATRPAGTPGSLCDISFDPCDLDFGRPAAARTRRRVDPHHSPRPTGAALDPTTGYAGLLCFSRSHFAGKSTRSCDLDSEALWGTAEDRG
jgi:hypothetical protein